MVSGFVTHINQPMEGNDGQEVINEFVFEVSLGYFFKILNRLRFALRLIVSHEGYQDSDREDDKECIVSVNHHFISRTVRLDGAEDRHPPVKVTWNDRTYQIDHVPPHAEVRLLFQDNKFRKFKIPLQILDNLSLFIRVIIIWMLIKSVGYFSIRSRVRDINTGELFRLDAKRLLVHPVLHLVRPGHLINDLFDLWLLYKFMLVLRHNLFDFLFHLICYCFVLARFLFLWEIFRARIFWIKGALNAWLFVVITEFHISILILGIRKRLNTFLLFVNYSRLVILFLNRPILFLFHIILWFPILLSFFLPLIIILFLM